MDLKLPHDALSEAVPAQLILDAEAASNTETFITLGYQCADWKWLVPNGVMAEVLALPKLNSVPRSPSYCWGICNVRGNIIPIFDLSELIKGQSDFSSRDKLYMLLQGPVSKQVGIIINDIPKSLQFSDGQKFQQASHVPDNFAPYVNGVFKEGDNIWHELDVAELLKSH